VSPWVASIASRPWSTCEGAVRRGGSRLVDVRRDFVHVLVVVDVVVTREGAVEVGPLVRGARPVLVRVLAVLVLAAPTACALVTRGEVGRHDEVSLGEFPARVVAHLAARLDDPAQRLVAEGAVPDERVLAAPDVQFRAADVGPYDLGEQVPVLGRREVVLPEFGRLRRFQVADDTGV